MMKRLKSKRDVIINVIHPNDRDFLFVEYKGASQDPEEMTYDIRYVVYYEKMVMQIVGVDELGENIMEEVVEKITISEPNKSKVTPYAMINGMYASLEQTISDMCTAFGITDYTAKREIEFLVGIQMSLGSTQDYGLSSEDWEIVDA